MTLAAYPFTAIFSQEEMKLGLLLGVIDPAIGGVLIAGHRGTGKSTAVRALAELLPRSRRVRECPYGCDPGDAAGMCRDCASAARSGRKLASEQRVTPVVELPLGTTEDRLCGSLDIERALHDGIKAFAPGLLARANRGFLYIDEVNLLEDHLVDLLLDVAATGWNIVEREGISLSHPARFVLIGSANPEEGELRPQLQDRFGLCVRVATLNNVGERIEIMRRRERFDRDGAAFQAAMASDQARLRRRIVRARRLLPHVTARDEVVETIAALCLRLEIVGHRGELTLLRASKGLAAFEGRAMVLPDDVRRVAVMALGHRLQRSVHGEMDATVRVQRAVEDTFSAVNPSSGRDSGENLVLSAVDTLLPRGICDTPVSDRAGDGVQRRRFGPVMPARGRAQRIAMDATVRAAAPFQPLRRQPEAHDCRIRIHADDLRFRKLRTEPQVLIVFVIDTSGSMAMNRIREAKGAVERLLDETHRRRHQVAVVAFRRRGAEVVLHPTRNKVRARRALESLAVGGATPLAAGIEAALAMARRARDAEGSQPRLVLLTDGGANTPIGRSASSNVWTELERICAAVRAESISSVVIDTRQPYLSRGKGEQLASMLRARYVSLPRPDAEGVYRAVTTG